MQKSTRKPLRNSPYQGRTSGDVLRTVDQLQDESRSRASELEKLKVALAAAHQDLLEANMQNNELSEELEWSMKELSELQKEKNDWRCRSWLDQATGRSTVLAAPEKAGDPSCHAGPGADASAAAALPAGVGRSTPSRQPSTTPVAEEDQLYSDPGSAARLQMNQPAEQPGSGHAEQQQCLQEQLHAALLENEQLRIRLEASTNQQPPAPQVEEQLVASAALCARQESQLQALQRKLEAQLEVAASKDAKIQVLQQGSDVAAAACAARAQELQILQQSLQSQEAQIGELRRLQAAIATAKDCLKEQTEQLTACLHEERGKATALLGRLDALQTEHTRTQEVVASQQQAIDVLSNAKEAYVHQLAEAERELRDLRKERSHHREQSTAIAALHTDLAEMQARCDALEKAREMAEQTLLDTAGQLAGAQACMKAQAALEQQLAGLKKANQHLQQSKDSLEDSMHAQHAELQTLQGQLSQAQAEASKLTEDLAGNQAMALQTQEALQQQLATSEATCTSLRDEKAVALQQAQRDMEAAVTTLQKHLDQALSSLDCLETEKAALQTSEEQAHEQRLEAEQQSREAAAHLQQLQAEAADLQQQQQDLQATCGAYEVQLRQRDRQLEDLRDAHSASAQQRQQNEQQLQEWQARHAASEQQQQQLQQEADRLAALVDELSAVKASQETRINKLHDDLQEAMQRLQEAAQQQVHSTAQHDASLAQLQAELDAVQQRTLLWKEQQDTLQRMQEELPGLQLEVDQLQAALRMAMSERDKALSQHTAVLAVSSGLQDQLEAAREQLAEQETQMAKLQAQAQDVAGLKQLAADLQQRVASVMAHNAGKDQQISSLSRSVSEKESRVAQLEAAAQDAERAQQAMREREQKKDAMLKQLCSQVASLQAQVAEHRGVRERLQAAVALALQTEASEGALAHPDSLRLAGTGVRAQTGGSHLQNLQQQSSTGGSAAPLQDRVQELEVALGSLKVRSDGLKTYLDITPAHESDRLSQGTNSSSLENVDTDGRRRPVAGSTSKQISTHRSLANGHSPQRRQPSSPAKALTPGRKVAASSTRSLLKSAAESPVSKRLASSMEAELKGSPGTQYAGLGAGTQPFGGAAANHANQPGLGKSRASGQKLVLLQ